MKIKTIIVFILLLMVLIPTIIKAQKYSTQEGYEKYFIENFTELDKFEGIWTKVMLATVAGENNPMGPEQTVTVAIIFEEFDNFGNKIFGEYYLIRVCL